MDKRKIQNTPKQTMMACLQEELELGRPLTPDEVWNFYIQWTVVGRPTKTIPLFIICVLGSCTAVLIIAIIAGLFDK